MLLEWIDERAGGLIIHEEGLINRSEEDEIQRLPLLCDRKARVLQSRVGEVIAVHYEREPGRVMG